MPTARIDDTLEMYYEDDAFTDPWATPEVVLLHHGNFKSSQLWYSWVPLLARDYRVLRLDARGFGRSTAPPPGYPWSMSNFARDVKGMLDSLGVEKVHYIGESLGGAIGLQFAYEYPERLRSFMPCGAPFKFHEIPGFVANRDLVAREGVEAYAKQTIGVRVNPEASPAEVEWNMRQVAGTKRRVAVETLTYLATVDLSDILPKIKVPTLCLFGKASPFPPREMHDLIPGSQLAIIDAPGLVQHTAPARCVEAWRQFTRGL